MLRRSKKKQEEREIMREKLFELYELHWNINSHYCKSCGKYLGKENKTTFHDHLLNKHKYPQYALDVNNLYLVCFECHQLKENGKPTARHKAAIIKVKELYGIR